MRNSFLLWLFEHSGPMTLCTCLEVLLAHVGPHTLGVSKQVCVYKLKAAVITYRDVY